MTQYWLALGQDLLGAILIAFRIKKADFLLSSLDIATRKNLCGYPILLFIDLVP